MQAHDSKIGQKILSHTFGKVQTGGNRFRTQYKSDQITGKHLQKVLVLKKAEAVFELVTCEDQEFTEWYQQGVEHIRADQEDHSNAEADASMKNDSE